MERVTFQSEGVALVGNLFLPETYESGQKLPAVIVGGSWITVKEQMAGLYANLFSKQGFAALAFDFRFFGESGGEPRQLESGKAKTQDFKNAMTFLQSLPMIDPKRVGGLAICASASYMARAVAEDDRFKAFVTVAGWFQHPETTPIFYGGQREFLGGWGLHLLLFVNSKRTEKWTTFQRTTPGIRMLQCFLK